ncbi:MAG: DegV family protein [Streptococcaceae bacterium]|jgi:DegV family protein with EDD domain|nr:DegV family protein [Streptococcaceae bacterium]
MTYTLITDSTADLDQTWCLDHQVDVLGMTITLDGKPRETVGFNALTSDELLAEMAKGADVATSAIGTGEFETVFKKHAEANEEVLYLAFSSGLSGTYQSAMIAKDMALEDFPDAKITIVDTLAAASGEGYLVEEAVSLRDAGKSASETAEAIASLTTRLRSWFMVDDLNHLARGGRIPKATALIGTLASIKPILDVDTAGKLRQVSRARGSKKAISELIKQSTQEADVAYPKVIVSYSGDVAPAETIAQQFRDSNPALTVAVRPLGPVISVHTGSGTLAIFTIGQEAKH